MEQKRGSKFLGIFCILLILAIIVETLVIAWYASGGKWGAKQENEETGSETEAEETASGVADEAGNELVSGTVYAMPKAMTYTVLSTESETAGEGITIAETVLSATVKPESSADKTVDWTIAFVNAESEWAAGKTVTDYVTLTPTADGATTATVKCIAEFGEQIVITVTSRSNEYATASCTVDYARKVTEVALSFGDVACDFETGRTAVALAFDPSESPTGGATDLSVTYNSDTYTVEDEFEVAYQFSSLPKFFCKEEKQSTGMSYFDYFVIAEEANGYSIAENGIYFGIQYFVEHLGMKAFSTVMTSIVTSEVWDAYSVSDLIERYEYARDGYSYTDAESGVTVMYTGVELFGITVSVTGSYSAVSKTTMFYVDMDATSIELSESAIVVS